MGTALLLEDAYARHSRPLTILVRPEQRSEVRIIVITVAPEWSSCAQRQQIAHSSFNDSTAPKRRILVADDNANVAESLAMLLRLLDHEVMTVYTGQSALAAAATFLPQVVFLDIGMPEMDGCDVAKRLREMPELSGTVLIALTGWGGEQDRRRAEEAGFDHYLLKPTETSVIVQLLAGLS
jgi:CheY-like chemotaxis protein